jgi:predicted amidophosphoribosyltransferase
MNEDLVIVSCQHCGHEWEFAEEVYCPLCRNRMDKQVKSVYQVGSKTYVVPRVLGDRPGNLSVKEKSR